MKSLLRLGRPHRLHGGGLKARSLKHALTLSLFVAGTALAGELSERFEKLHELSFDFPDGMVSRGSRPLFFDRKPTEIRKISIERTPGLGVFPIYTASLSADGTVQYFGQRNVERQGHFTAKVFPSDFNSLAEFIVESKYDQLRDAYHCAVDDAATVYTSVTFANHTKLILNHADSGPATLWAIQMLIDQLISKAHDWKQVEPAQK